MHSILRRSASRLVVIALLLGSAPPLLAKAPPVTAKSAAKVTATTGQPWLYKGSDVPVDRAWIFGTLPNGLRYAVRRNGVPPGQVAIRVRVDAGSLMERDGEEGFAHLLEHLTFRGSKYVPDGEAKRVWQRMGATFGSDSNAQTTPTQTVYRLDLPQATPQTLDESMKILSGMITEPSLTDQAVNSERAVVSAERREGSGPGVRVGDATRALFFAGQPLATRSPIGSVAALEAARAPAVKAFHDRWYRPENVVIAASGDIDPAALEQAIGRYFGDWKPDGKGEPHPNFGTPDPKAPASAVIVEPGLPTMLSFAFLRPWKPKNDTIAYNQQRIIDMLALQLINRRLEARARAGGSYLQAGVDQDDVSRSADGTFISIMPLGDDWKAALNDVRAVIEDARATPPSQGDIDREYAQFDAAMAISVENKDTEAGAKQTDDIVQAVDIRETVASPDTALKILRDMKRMFTPATMLKATRRMFEGVATRSLLVLPKAQPDAQAQLATALATPVKAAVDVRLTAGKVTADDLPKLGTPATVTSRESIGQGMEMVTFSNGVRLSIFSNAAESGKVRVNVRFGRGQLAFSPTNPVASWAGGYALMASGIGDLDQQKLDQFTNGRRISMDFSVDDNAFEMSAVTRPVDFADQMHLLAAKLAAPRWDAAPVERVKAGMLAGYDSMMQAPDSVLQSRLPQLLRAGDVRFRTPSREEISALTPAAFRATWEPVLQSGPIEVQVFGDMPADKAIEVVGATFGALAPRPETPVPPANRTAAFPAHNEAPLILRHSGDKDQAAAVIAWPTGGGMASAKESRQLEMLAQIFNDRLFEGLRSIDGAAYSPSVQNQWPFAFDSGGYIRVTSQVQPDKVGYFFKVAKDVAADLAAQPIGADELKRAVAPMQQLLQRASSGNAFWMTQMEGATYDRRYLDIMRSMGPDMLTVTPADIQRLAQKYLVPGKSWSAVVLPEGVEAK